MLFLIGVYALAKVDALFIRYWDAYNESEARRRKLAGYLPVYLRILINFNESMK